MKYLTVCERGNSRSVALAWILKDHLGHEAIACGIKVASYDTFKMLCKWADTIILVDKSFEDLIPKRYKKKLLVFDVGPDRFFRGFEQDLINMFGEYLLKEGISK